MKRKKSVEVEVLPKKELLRVDEVAALLNRSRSDVQRWIDHGKLPIEFIDGIAYIAKSSLDGFHLA
jgi:excisionase family DNA binding protein